MAIETTNPGYVDSGSYFADPDNVTVPDQTHQEYQKGIHSWIMAALPGLVTDTDLQDEVLSLKQAQGLLAIRQAILNNTSVNSNYYYAVDEYEDETGVDSTTMLYNSSTDSYRTATGSHQHSLLIQSEGNVLTAVDGGTAFVDTADAKTVTTAGGLNTQINGADSPYADDSSIAMVFDGSGDNIQVPDSAAFDYSGAFSVCCWFKAADLVGNQALVSKAGTASAKQFQIRLATDKVEFMLSTDGTNWADTLVSTTTIATDTWYYALGTRDAGNNLNLYVGTAGTLSSEDTGSVAGTVANISPGVGIGMEYTGSGQPFNGKIADARVIGSVLSNVVPTTKPTFSTEDAFVSGAKQSGEISYGIRDEAGSALTSQGNPYLDCDAYGGTEPVFYHDASGDYAYTEASTDWGCGSNEFTIEGWHYRQDNSAADQVLGQWESAGSNRQFWFNIEASGVCNVRLSADGSATTHNVTSTSSGERHQWNHYAFVREGNTGYFYINGVQDATTVDLTAFSMHAVTSPAAGEELAIGAYNAAGTGAATNCFIADQRFWNSTAKYTGNFTPATSKPAKSDETLYVDHAATNQTFVDTTTTHALVTTGDATHLDVGSAKFGTQFIRFVSGSITASDSADFEFGAGAFTVDMFVKFDALGSAECLIQKGNNASANMEWKLSKTAGDEFQFDHSTTGTAYATPITTTSAGLVAGTWHHVRVVSDGATNGTIYVDGTSRGTGTIGTIATSAIGLVIGQNQAGTELLVGGLEEISVFKGTARDSSVPIVPYDVSTTDPELDSISFTAGTAPTKIAAVMLMDPVDAVTVNTDYIVSVSPTATYGVEGTDHAVLSMAFAGVEPSSGANIYVGEVDVSGLTAGTTIRYFLRGGGNLKDLIQHSAYLYYAD